MKTPWVIFRFCCLTLSTGISTNIYGLIVHWVSVEHRSSVGQGSVGYWLSIGRYLGRYVCQSSNGWHINQYLADAQSILDGHSTDTQPILNRPSSDCRLIYQQCIGLGIRNECWSMCWSIVSGDITYSKHDTNAFGVCKMRNNKWYTIFWSCIRLRAGGGTAPTLNSRYHGGRKSSQQLSSDDSEDETSFQYKHQNIKRGSNGAC